MRTIIELWTDERRVSGGSPQTIPAPGHGCWSEGDAVWRPHTGTDDPRRIWWDHVPEGHCPLCKERLCIAGKPSDYRLFESDGWMHCWTCRWSVRMRTVDTP